MFLWKVQLISVGLLLLVEPHLSFRSNNVRIAVSQRRYVLVYSYEQTILVFEGKCQAFFSCRTILT